MVLVLIMTLLFGSVVSAQAAKKKRKKAKRSRPFSTCTGIIRLAT